MSGPDILHSLRYAYSTWLSHAEENPKAAGVKMKRGKKGEGDEVMSDENGHPMMTDAVRKRLCTLVNLKDSMKGQWKAGLYFFLL
jgi:hypothetical protein